MSASHKPLTSLEEKEMFDEIEKLKKLYLANLQWDTSHERTQRARAVKGLEKITAFLTKSKEVNESLQKVAGDAMLALGDIYLSEWKKSYPTYQNIITYFDMLEHAGKKLDDQQFEQMKEKLLTVLVNHHLPALVADLRVFVTSKEEKAQNADKIFSQLGGIVDKQITGKHIKRGGITDLGDLCHELGKYEMAAKRYHQAIELGERGALEKLAQAYYEGNGVEKNKDRGDKYTAEYYVSCSKLFFESASISSSYHHNEIENSLKNHDSFMSGLAYLKKAVDVSPEIKISIPAEAFIIRQDGILDFLMLAKDEKMGPMVKEDKRAIDAIDKWFQESNSLFSILQLQDVKREQLIYRILTEKHTGNELAKHFSKKLETALSSSPQHAKILAVFREYDKRFEEALKAEPTSKEKKETKLSTAIERKVESIVERPPTATYTSATSAPSWREKTFNFFDRKAGLIREVKEKQQAMNDRDPEDLYGQGRQSKGKKRGYFDNCLSLFYAIFIYRMAVPPLH